MNGSDGIVLTPEAGEILRLEALAAFKSLPRRGAEIGGFLTASAKSRDRLCADGVTFVSSEHLHGPSYRLSPADLDLFRYQVRLAKANLTGTPVAFFRSCTREQFTVQPDDVDTVREVLPGVRFVILLKPFASGNSAVRVFSAQDLGLLAEFELSMRLAGPEQPPISPDAAMASPPPLRIRGTAPWPRYFVFAGLLVAVAGLLVWAYRFRHPPPAAPVASDLGLRVETHDNSFRVTWNRTLPVFQNSSGLLNIDDGSHPRVLQLDRNQIASGSLVYVSNSPDLTFRMQVGGERGRQATETLRVVVAPTRLPAAAQTAAQTASQGTPKLVIPVVRSWPSAGPKAGIFRPARPLSQIAPQVQSSFIQKPTVVEVIVKVDDKGRVTSARELHPHSPVPAGVPAQAVEASKQWTFEPAQRRGRKVLSDYNIVYSFKPQ